MRVIRGEVLAALSISRQSWDAWTGDARAQLAEQRRDAIMDLWLRCRTQREIADAVGMSQPAVAGEIEDFIKSAKTGGSDIFRNFEQDEGETSGRRVYDTICHKRLPLDQAHRRDQPAAGEVSRSAVG